MFALLLTLGACSELSATISSLRMYDTKLNLRWNNDESLLTYNRNVYYVFVPEKSIGDPRDYIITALNIPLAVS